MVDILVRNVDGATAAQLKKKAKAAGKSVNDIAREALRAAAKPSKEEAWAEIDRIRKKIGKVSGDSTQIIREWRDNDEPYR
jgi:plasmid stability protein